MKKIVIVGGGISGLSLLHFLKKRFNNTVDISLLERESTVGGTIRTASANNCLFENGPNGFLDNQPVTFELINELGLNDQLIAANPAIRRRYIQFKGKLYQVAGLLGFIQTPLLSPWAKIRLIQGLFNKQVDLNQSIESYVTARFGVRVSERIADPFISGIYAGNIKRLHMASCFPKFAQMGKTKKKMKMHSFKKGMGQLIEALYAKHQSSIETNAEISSLAQIKADLIILATPAYVSARLVEEENPSLSHLLDKIPYAPIAVVGLTLKPKYLKKKPDGFGYLIPSSEKKDALGVLIESNVFPGRSSEDQVMLRVMLGGMHHPAIINDSADQILAKAIKEIDSTYGLTQMPLQSFTKIWPKAIPQYECNYPDLRQAISRTLQTTPHLQLCANYLDGVSFNDCINNAKSIAGAISI